MADPAGRDAVVYAVGGGSGHAVRGAAVQARLPGALLVVRRGSLPPAVTPTGPVRETDGPLPPEALVRGGTLLVDTFPTGWLGRLPIEAQAGFSRRVLVARAILDGTAPLPGTESFDEIWSPYPEGASEWRCPLPAAIHTGHLLRSWPVRWTRERGPRLHVWDPGRRVDAALAAVIAKAARRVGLSVDLVQGPPVAARARKHFVIGAGYNTFYESRRQGVDTAHLPIRRRWDDQAARASRFGRAIRTPQELATWLAEG